MSEEKVVDIHPYDLYELLEGIHPAEWVLRDVADVYKRNDGVLEIDGVLYRQNPATPRRLSARNSDGRGRAMTIQSLKLTCYVCGKSAGKMFYLVSPRTETDRPFAVCDRSCAESLDDDASVLLVQKFTLSQKP